MNDMLNTQISYYETLQSQNNSIYSIKQILDFIEQEKFKNQIDALRNETNKVKKDELKKKLPAVTISGIFKGSRKKENIINHSGLIQVDLDNVENLESVKNLLINDDHSFAVFESPSGRGLKILVKITPEINLHEWYFLELEKYYLLKYKLIIDSSCKDVTRLMFLCSDRNIIIKPASKNYELNTLNKDEVLFATVWQKVNKKNEFKEGKRNDYVFKLACECSSVGVEEKNCLIFCNKYFVENGFDKTEIKNTISSAYSNKKDKNDVKEKLTLLKIRTANQTLRDANLKPVPKMLFSEFWYEGEICILFADTNVGKSILAVQIANSISKGEPIQNFKLEAKRQQIIYLDCEMSEKQFQKRYSAGYKHDYCFDDNFIRIEIDGNFTDYVKLDLQIFLELELELEKQTCKIIIIDNITFLKDESTEKANEALQLMKKLIYLKKKFGLSVLILAHTPKVDLSKSITKNYLAGSKQIANFCDSIFCIGESSLSIEKKYFKQLKARSTEILYHSDYVIICKLYHNFNFLEFQFLEYGEEREHLKQQTNSQRSEIEAKILELKTANPEISLREIARIVDTNAMTVLRIIKKNSL